MAELTLEQAPRKAREHFDKGFAALERGNLDYAMDMFLLALDLCPQLLRVRRFLRGAEIKKLLDSKSGSFARSLAPVKGMGKLMKAQSQLKKDPLAALRTTEDLLRIDPLNVQFITLHGEAAEAADMPEVAIMTLELYREQNPGDVKVLRWLAKLYQSVNRMHEAREVYEDVQRILPKDPRAIKDLKDATALDTMQRGRWEEEGDFRSKIKDEKESAQLEQAGKAVKSEKDVEELIQESIKKIATEPENINYKRGLADLYSKSDRFDEAIEVLEQAQAQTGGGDPQIDRLLSTMKIRKIEREVADLTRAGNTAAAEAKQTELDTFLLADARERVERYPNDLQFRYELGVLLFEHEDINGAIQQFQLSQRNPQRRIRSLYYLARCFKSKHQYDIASEQLTKAAAELSTMDDTKKDILYELGDVYEAMKQMDKAREYYKQIYAVDISYRDVAQKIDSSYSAS
ncbi:MAG: tetratricopeptide repeat protein [Verrucomicrobia bacterium]|nr:tetratricopeptide repeat protein [Verrucomicrobiota bacterium]